MRQSWRGTNREEEQQTGLEIERRERSHVSLSGDAALLLWSHLCGAYRSSSDDFHGLLPALIAAAPPPPLLLPLLLLLWQVANFRHSALPDGGATDYRLQLQLARLTSNSESESDVVYAARRAGEAGRGRLEQGAAAAGKPAASLCAVAGAAQAAPRHGVAAGVGKTHRCTTSCRQAGEEELEMATEELAQLEKEGHKISRCCWRCFW